MIQLTDLDIRWNRALMRSLLVYGHPAYVFIHDKYSNIIRIGSTRRDAPTDRYRLAFIIKPKK